MKNDREIAEDGQWHHLEAADVLRRQQSDLHGLDETEAARRLQEYGPNRLRPPRRRGPLRRFFAQFHNVLIYVLLAAGIVTAAMNDWTDASVIFGVVILNALVGFIQEGKAEQALRAIHAMLSVQAMVIRRSERKSISAERLVPGDIVLLQSGDKVPADVRLIQVKDLRVDEAALTGESAPVDKSVEPTRADAPVSDRTCMAYSGTLVTYGQALGIVVATGDATEIGRISALLADVQTLTTPLLRKMTHFGRWLTIAILLITAMIFIYGVGAMHQPWVEMLSAAVGLAVAAIPEGLPAVITITLAIGVQRMARRNAIVRRLPAVETLGSVTVICTDKTGTLTRNEMTVQTLATSSHVFTVTGGGYAPEGEIRFEGKAVSPHEFPELREIAYAALLCNEAAVCLEENGQWCVHGDPTEGALVTLAMKLGLDMQQTRAQHPRVDAVPFESQHRYMATLHRHPQHGATIYVKGAPERVIAMCDKERRDGTTQPLDHAKWNAHLEAIASEGQRMLAIAVRDGEDIEDLTHDHVQSGLTLLGVAGLVDPPRDEAIAAVRLCQRAGIRIKMITGDHAATARAIGARLNIGDGRSALTGHELDAMDTDALKRAALDIDVFARVSPEHKLRLVEALQASDEITAMTGDGVNDGPALKRADVGVAMGQKGTEVAKEAADVVLADDNFASIAHAVEEGRTIYDNIRKSILFILPTNGGQALTIVAAILIGYTLPITPVQILWVNMVTAVTLALALSFEPTEANAMRRPPRDPRAPMISRAMALRIAWVTALLVAATFGAFLWQEWRGSAIEYARTVAVNTLVVCEIFYLLSSRFFDAPAMTRQGLTGNRYVWIAIASVVVLQLIFTYTQFFQRWFGTASLNAATWFYILCIGVAVFALIELEKRWNTRRAQM